MTQTEAEKLLGGYATGTLTEAERQTLFTAALARQELFDALVDEEALRELLADPAAKAQLLAALSPTALSKVVPLWRRTGVLGAAAGLIVAATAGLAYLRSPERVHPALEQEREQPAKAKAAEPPAEAQAPTLLARKAPAPPAPASGLATPAQERAAKLAPPPPRPVTAAGAAPAVESALRAKEQDQDLRVEAHEKVAKAVGGVGSRTAAADQAGRLGGGLSSSPAAPAETKSARRVEGKAAALSAPTWTLEWQPDGTTRVLVKGPARAQTVLLRRRASELEVLALKVIDPSGDMTQWRAEVRLAAGDVLDLYLLNSPVADPAKLPETGHVDGYRVRIYPAAR